MPIVVSHSPVGLIQPLAERAGRGQRYVTERNLSNQRAQLQLQQQGQAFDQNMQTAQFQNTLGQQNVQQQQFNTQTSIQQQQFADTQRRLLEDQDFDRDMDLRKFAAEEANKEADRQQRFELERMQQAGADARVQTQQAGANRRNIVDNAQRTVESFIEGAKKLFSGAADQYRIQQAHQAIDGLIDVSDETKRRLHADLDVRAAGHGAPANLTKTPTRPTIPDLTGLYKDLSANIPAPGDSLGVKQVRSPFVPLTPGDPLPKNIADQLYQRTALKMPNAPPDQIAQAAEQLAGVLGWNPAGAFDKYKQAAPQGGQPTPQFSYEELLQEARRRGLSP